MIKLIKTYFKLLSFISPKLAANKAFKIFKTVRKKDIRKREQSFYEEAQHSKLVSQNESIDTYEFGTNNGDIVILLHGWDSNAGSLYQFVAPLRSKNKKIYSINLPGHAFDANSETTIVACKNALKALLNSIPEHSQISIISHSFGSAVTAYALSESNRSINHLFFLTSPNRLEELFYDFKNMIGLNNKAYNLLLGKAKQITKEDISQITVQNKLKKASFKHLYLFHDEHDKVIPFKNSLDISQTITHSTLHKFKDIGHYRMLWNKSLIETVIKYF